VREHADALLGQGRCMLALDRPDDAAAPLTAARQLLTGLQAAALIAEVDACLCATPRNGRSHLA
jgi:hypothetical protein